MWSPFPGPRLPPVSLGAPAHRASLSQSSSLWSSLLDREDGREWSVGLFRCRPPLAHSLAALSLPCRPAGRADRRARGGRAGGGGSSGSGSLCSCSGGSGEDGGPGGFPVCGSQRRRRSLRGCGRGGCPGPGRDSGASRANGPGAGSRAVPLPDARSGLSGEWGRRRGARAGGGAERGPGSDRGGGEVGGTLLGGIWTLSGGEGRQCGGREGRRLASSPSPGSIVSFGESGYRNSVDEVGPKVGMWELECRRARAALVPRGTQKV